MTCRGQQVGSAARTGMEASAGVVGQKGQREQITATGKHSSKSNRGGGSDPMLVVHHPATPC